MSIELNTASTTELLSWGYETYGDTLAFSTAFGPSGIVLMHLAAQIPARLEGFLYRYRVSFRGNTRNDRPSS